MQIEEQELAQAPTLTHFCRLTAILILRYPQTLDGVIELLDTTPQEQDVLLFVGLRLLGGMNNRENELELPNIKGFAQLCKRVLSHQANEHDLESFNEFCTVFHLEHFINRDAYFNQVPTLFHLAQRALSAEKRVVKLAINLPFLHEQGLIVLEKPLYDYKYCLTRYFTRNGINISTQHLEYAAFVGDPLITEQCAGIFSNFTIHSMHNFSPFNASRNALRAALNNYHYSIFYQITNKLHCHADSLLLAFLCEHYSVVNTILLDFNLVQSDKLNTAIRNWLNLDIENHSTLKRAKIQGILQFARYVNAKGCEFLFNQDTLSCITEITNPLYCLTPLAEWEDRLLASYCNSYLGVLTYLAAPCWLVSCYSTEYIGLTFITALVLSPLFGKIIEHPPKINQGALRLSILLTNKIAGSLWATPELLTQSQEWAEKLSRKAEQKRVLAHLESRKPKDENNTLCILM